jgi:HSP20 family protein
MARFDPFSEVEDLFRGLRPSLRALENEPELRLEVTEDDKAYTVKAEIPGARKDDIEISIDRNQVSIGAEVRREKETKQGETVVYSERYYGKAYRSFALPVEVDSGKAEAQYEGGVLSLTLPKKQNGGSRRIAVS